MDRAAPPTTRRELRLAEAAAQRHRRSPVASIPVAAVARGISAFALPFSARTAAAVAVAVSAALCGGGMAQGYSNGVDLTARNVRAAAAEARQDASRLRSDEASGARLEGESVRFAASQRAQALAAAQTAVATAQAVSTSSVADVAPDALTPLGDATASLTAMIGALPVATTPVLVGPAAVPVATTSTPAEAATSGQAAEPVPGEPVATVPAAPVFAVPTASPFTDPDAAASDDAKPGASVLVPLTVARDLEASARMLAAAVSVIDLSGQLQVVAAANVAAAAEAANAAAAEATARAYARSHSMSKALARKVTAVQAAGNGAIPVDQLCAPKFAPTALLRCDAAEALSALDVAYRAEFGTHLAITSTYRTLAEQVTIKASRGGLAATPGSSNHGLGLAADLGGFGGVGQFSAPTYLWMKSHASEFGWSHPKIMEPGGGGPQEPWHWEFGTA